MTAEEVFDDLSHKYGEDFSWHMLPFTNKTFVAELKNEIGEHHFLHNKQIYAVAKCDSNDDVLFVADNEDGVDVYYIFHLTYSKVNINGCPQYVKFKGIPEVKEYIEQSYVRDFL